VSHEFKNPLSIIREALSLVLEGLTGGSNQKQAAMLQMAKRNTDRLIRLVMDLLDVSKIEAGKMKLKREAIEIGPLVDEIVANNNMEIEKKKLMVKKDIPQDIGLVTGDKDRLTQVVINLLSNAVKYTPEGGSVDIKLRGTREELRFEISDTGPGITKKDCHKLFDKFERLTAERQEGTGLGLSIAKDIIELHKGKIWVESEAGKGTRFIFTLPRNMENTF
jgi:signal transduction histidine kinase